MSVGPLQPSPIKFNFVAGMLSYKIFDQLHGLSLCQISIFNVDPYVLKPGLEN